MAVYCVFEPVLIYHCFFSGISLCFSVLHHFHHSSHLFSFAFLASAVALLDYVFVCTTQNFEVAFCNVENKTK